MLQGLVQPSGNATGREMGVTVPAWFGSAEALHMCVMSCRPHCRQGSAPQRMQQLLIQRPELLHLHMDMYSSSGVAKWQDMGGTG